MAKQARTTEHISKRNGRPFCGSKKRKYRKARGVSDLICEDCLHAYQSYAFDQIHRRVAIVGKDIGVYLALIPKERRDREFEIIMKTLEIKAHKYLEGE